MLAITIIQLVSQILMKAKFEAIIETFVAVQMVNYFSDLGVSMPANS